MTHPGRDRRGATSIEYALIAGIVALSIVVGASQLGESLAGIFSFFADEIDGTTDGI